MSELRVATWNIRKCIGLDRRRDPSRVARVLSNLNVDLVALQEADKRMGNRPAALTSRIIEAETNFRAVEAGGHAASIGWHGNALLLRLGIRQNDRHSLQLPGLEPRGALVVDLARDCGDPFIRVVCVHLGLLRASRRLQLRSIREHLDGLSPLPTLILGDFNEWTPSRGFEQLDGFEVHTPGRSFHAARPVAALDRLALDSQLQLLDAGVVRTADTRIASDHLPIWGQIRINPT